jgi:hypothetical protein
VAVVVVGSALLYIVQQSRDARSHNAAMPVGISLSSHGTTADDGKRTVLVSNPGMVGTCWIGTVGACCIVAHSVPPTASRLW